MSSYTSDDKEFYEVEDYILQMMDNAARFGITSREMYGSTWPIPHEVKFDTINEVQVYIDRIKISEWAKAEWPRHSKRVLVKPHLTGREDEGEYHGTAYHQDGVIYIPEHGAGHSRFMRELYVLHELAHYYSSDNHHTDKFRATLIKLVENQIDPMFAMFYRICISAGPDNL